MHTKEDYTNQYLNFSSNDKENVDALISGLETYISENGCDLQLELILYAYRKYKVDDLENCYEKACEAAAPVFELLENTNWGWLEIQVLACVIGHVPYYTMGEKLVQQAFDILDNKFADHEYYEFTKFRFYMNFTLRLLRARYYEATNPADIQAKFDQCLQQAISFCEKNNYITFRTVLLVRQAVFYGDSNRILECMDALKVTGDKMWIRTTKDEVVEYFQCLGGNVTTDLKNLIVGWQIYKRRKELGMSTSQLADAIDATSTSAINLYERGERGVGTAKLCKVAEVLKVSIFYFFGGIGTESAHAITDIPTHIMGQFMAQMSEREKDFMLEMARNLIKGKVMSLS